MATVNLNNITYRSMIGHKTKNIIALAGERTLVILSAGNDSLSVVFAYVEENKQEDITSVDFLSIDGQDYCAIGGRVGVAKIIDIKNGNILGYLTAHNKPITTIRAFGEYFMTGSEDTTMKLWSYKNLSGVSLLGGGRGHSGEIASIDVHTTSKKIVSSGMDLKIIEWEFVAKNSTYSPIFEASNIYRCFLNNIIYYGNLIVCLCRNKRVLFLKPVYRPTQSSIKSTKSDEVYSILGLSQSLLGPEYSFLRSTEAAPFYNTSIFSSPLISVENMNLHNGNLEISSNFQLVKDIELVHGTACRILISNHTLFCLSTYRFIYKINLKLLFQDYKIKKLKLKYKMGAINFAITKEFIFVLYEDGVVESIEINNVN
ncbi:Polycomb group protein FERTILIZATION-INDEPENDENT ENDOSPERM [Nosema granulosis]|uniref:Polycomb group protein FERTILIZATION-INDEPENDENT ENDOSPERM n=1 Tax=Nosema granulosis TaxID=83296 RepID=A0A9P6KYZ8_9MICR|nr:Polycomb group protein FERTILIZATION-INDEPENDENT ENDOSPERM [Nosema granulosis]